MVVYACVRYLPIPQHKRAVIGLYPRMCGVTLGKVRPEDVWSNN